MTCYVHINSNIRFTEIPSVAPGFTLRRLLPPCREGFGNCGAFSHTGTLTVNGLTVP